MRPNFEIKENTTLKSCVIYLIRNRTILSKAKTREERLFYIKKAAEQRMSREELSRSIDRDDYHHKDN